MRRPRVLLDTWRRQGRVFGPPLRDMYGAEVQYVHAVQRAGAAVLLAPEAIPDTDPHDLLDGMDGLVLIGGEDLAAPTSGADPDLVGANTSPERDLWEIRLLAAALERDLPVLAVCRGLQLLKLGARRDPARRHRRPHPRAPGRARGHRRGARLPTHRALRAQLAAG